MKKYLIAESYGLGDFQNQQRDSNAEKQSNHEKQRTSEQRVLEQVGIGLEGVFLRITTPKPNQHQRE